MSDALTNIQRVTPINGPEKDRLFIKDHADLEQVSPILPGELHATYHKRLFIEHELVSYPEFHGEVADEAALLLLFSGPRGCWPGDNASINGKEYICIAGNGTQASDWWTSSAASSEATAYDDTNTQMGATTTQGAIEWLHNNAQDLADVDATKSPLLNSTGSGISIIQNAATGTVRSLVAGNNIILTETTGCVSIEATGGGSGGSTAAFIPSAIPALQLWLSSTVGVLNASGSPCANGEAVATWQDQSGKGRHATQSTSTKRPVYTSNFQNGLGCVTLDDLEGSDTKGVSIPNQDLYDGWGIKDNFEIFVLRKRRSASGNAQIVSVIPSPQSGNSNYINAHAPYVDGNFYFDFGHPSNRRISINTNSLSIDYAEWQVVSVGRKLGYAWIGNETGPQYEVHSSFGRNNGPGMVSEVLVGGHTISGIAANSHFAEYLIFNRVLTDIERSQVISWANKKWGLGDY